MRFRHMEQLGVFIECLGRLDPVIGLRCSFWIQPNREAEYQKRILCGETGFCGPSNVLYVKLLCILKHIHWGVFSWAPAMSLEH